MRIRLGFSEVINSTGPFLFTTALCVFVLSLFQSFNAKATGYKQPSEAIAEFVNEYNVPDALVSPKGRWMALLEGNDSEKTGALHTKNLLAIAFNPLSSMQINIPRYTSVSFKHIDTGAVIRPKAIPEGNILHPTWSANDRYMAFVLETKQAAHLWVYDLKQKKSRILSQFPLNGFTMNKPFEWLADSSGLIANIRVNNPTSNQRHKPEASVQQPLVISATASLAKGASSEFGSVQQDEFKRFAFGQLYKLPLQGRAVGIGQPAYFSDFSASPDATNILVAMMDMSQLPDMQKADFDRQRYSVWQIWGMRGIPLYEVYRPQEVLQIANVLSEPFSQPVVKRAFQWRADKGATLVWAESSDGEENESLYSISAPFKREPRLYAETPGRVSHILWGDSQLAILVMNQGNGKMTYYAFSPLTPDRSRVPLNLFDDLSAGSSRELIHTKNDLGVDVVKVAGGRYLFLKGIKRENGVDTPYLSRFDARGNLFTSIWQSSAPYFEQVIDVISDDGMRFVTQKQSKSNPANYFSRNLTFDTVEQLTRNRHPYPSMQAISKEEMSFKAGGHTIKGDFYLPNSFDPSNGRIPVLIWLNMQQKKTSKGVKSPYLFSQLNALNGAAYVHEGYAVLNIRNLQTLDQQMHGEELSKYLQDSAQAIVSTLIAQGIADKNKIALGGHGLAATNVVKLLAETDLFVTGIARSGTYNLTLAPFMFGQGEESLWANQSKYIENSVIFKANDVNTSLLLVHGYQDRGNGSYPIQSERLFSAMNDMGKSVRLVMLPNSGHMYSEQEEVLHMLYEQSQWLKLHFESLPEIEVSDTIPEIFRFELPAPQEQVEYSSPWG
ncbi:alpha/beta hydrolase family protein [Pseudoalteromonas luteoviolacea]|uniref:alpha/beta hydrolase family protein n=1 Tax=Pseudoalteromonas luteoviolacea TaxID=43657 RepID=UPI0011508393|nr:prolyl oligopeptidase family serine peptidase [Pseudoalteromonas luteoviolacea]TQF67625.1 prolyl oligopeptidase family serine peptidase [Pseudoalteromonas luteoviolacea]